MEDDEIFDQFYFKFSNIFNSSFNRGEQISSSKIIWKILRSLLREISSQGYSHRRRDIDALKVENLVGSLQTFEVNFRQPK